jgi:hypothetical protein
LIITIAIVGRPSPHRSLYRQSRRRIGVRRRRSPARRIDLDLLFGIDPLARCRVHQNLRTPQPSGG